MGRRCEAPTCGAGPPWWWPPWGAEGVSRVSGLSHIRRGYQGLDDSLSALGADIRTQL